MNNLKGRIKRGLKKLSGKDVPESGWHKFNIMGLKWNLCMDRYIDRTIATEGAFEPETTAIVLKLVKPGMHILDVGANIGYFTNILAKKVGKTGKIHAFEPVSTFREQVIWHVENNHFKDIVKIYPYGLSDAEKELKIGMDNTSASLHWTPGTPPTDHEVIKLKSLDSIFKKEGINGIDLIKIDIDGHEPFFIDGAKEFFKDNQPVILIEFANLNLFVAGSDVIRLKEKLEQMNYVLYSEKTGVPFKSMTEFLTECGNYKYSANVWAIPSKKVKSIQNLREL